MSNQPGSFRHIMLGALAVVAVSWLMPRAPLPEAASVQVPDAGRQRQDMIEELRSMNKKLTEISEILKEARDAQAKAEKKDGAGAGRGKP